GVSDDNTVLRVPLVAADPSASTGDQNHPVPFLLAEQGECTFCQFVFVEREGPGDLVMPGVPGLVDNAEIFAGGGVPEFRERACPSLPVDVSGEDARTVLGAETRTPPCCLVQVLRNGEHSGLAVDFLAHESRGAAVRQADRPGTLPRERIRPLWGPRLGGGLSVRRVWRRLRFRCGRGAGACRC